MQKYALPIEVASPSPEPSRTRYQEVGLPFTQRESPWGRAAKSNANEGTFMLLFSFSCPHPQRGPHSCKLYLPARQKRQNICWITRTLEITLPASTFWQETSTEPSSLILNIINHRLMPLRAHQQRQRRNFSAITFQLHSSPSQIKHGFVYSSKQRSDYNFMVRWINNWSNTIKSMEIPWICTKNPGHCIPNC